MKNKEFYKDKIYEAACKYRNLAVDKETGELSRCHTVSCKDCALSEFKVDSCIGAWKLWLEQEHEEPILNDAEKWYLETILRPFKDGVQNITKINVFDNYSNLYVEVTTRVGSVLVSDDFALPIFNENEKYLGMEFNRDYTLEELGLFTNEEEDNEEQRILQKQDL